MPNNKCTECPRVGTVSPQSEAHVGGEPGFLTYLTVPTMIPSLVGISTKLYRQHTDQKELTPSWTN